jgi:drug/metabolite transporter (DMT)-like permease
MLSLPIWIWPLAVYFFGTAANTILQRKTAIHEKLPSRLIMFLTFALFLYPIALATALIIGNFWLDWQPAAALALAIDALGMGLYFVFALHLNRKVEAIEYSVITNMYMPVTVLLGVFVLGNRLTDVQFIALLLLIIGATLVVAKQLSRDALSFDRYSIYLLVASVGLGIGLAAERACLNYMSPSTYMVIGYGLQTLIIAASVRKAWPRVRKIHAGQWLNISKLGITRACWNLGFLGSVALSGNVSLIATVSSFRVPLIFITSFFLLRGERDHLKRKFIGVLIATIGLLLV